MKIICNGTEKQISSDTTLLDFIEKQDLNPDTVVAEYEGKIISRDEYETLILAGNSKLELIRFVGGG